MRVLLTFVAGNIRGDGGFGTAPEQIDDINSQDDKDDFERDQSAYLPRGQRAAEHSGGKSLIVLAFFVLGALFVAALDHDHADYLPEDEKGENEYQIPGVALRFTALTALLGDGNALRRKKDNSRRKQQ